MTDNNTNLDALALAKLAHANGHGELASDESLRHYANAVLLARETTCARCAVIAEVIPVAHHRWAVEEHHEDHCPQHDDNTTGLHRDATLYPPTLE